MYCKGRNILSKIDLETFYESEQANVDYTSGHITRIIFDIALVSSWRSGMFELLLRDQVTKLNAQGKSAFRITARIAAGDEKTAQGAM